MIRRGIQPGTRTPLIVGPWTPELMRTTRSDIHVLRARVEVEAGDWTGVALGGAEGEVGGEADLPRLVVVGWGVV